MPADKRYHDLSKFYHCTCLDDGSDMVGEHDHERFYHCSCIEDGYEPDETKDQDLAGDG